MSTVLSYPISSSKLAPFGSREEVPLSCSYCGCVFYRKKHDIQISMSRGTKVFYCNRQCSGKANIRTGSVFCANCSKEFVQKSIEQKFCSRSCGAIYNNKKRSLTPTFVCEGCSEETTRTFKNQRFCSRLCSGAAKKGTGKRTAVDKMLYMREYMTARNRAFKQKCASLFGSVCSKCGYSKSMSALEFHHLDPTVKDFALGHKRGLSEEALRKEIGKCILLCANCHREEHQV